ncbi:MAG: acyl-CoA dehydrogenase family protein [Panacagrimonas sp.]
MILTDDQRALRDTARRFAEHKLLPDDQKREQSERLDRDLVREIGELGL